MRIFVALGFVLAVAASASAAPNVAQASQKGSLLVFPDIRIDNENGLWNTLVRLQNDRNLALNVVCYWMDGNKHRVDFSFVITREQPVWFDARTGAGSNQVNRFPQGPAGGFDNPHLITPPATTEAADGAGPYLRGTLVCFVVEAAGQQQVRANHLAGTATLWHPTHGSFEYNAYAFFASAGVELGPVGTAGQLNLDGFFYDSCPLYQIGQFTPSR
jgi:hypothetical protein